MLMVHWLGSPIPGKMTRAVGDTREAQPLLSALTEYVGVGLVLFCPSESIAASSSPHPGAQREDRQALESDTREFRSAFARH